MKKNKRCGLKRTLAAVVFCAVLGAGTVCSAEEGKVVAAGAYIRAAADASSAQLASIKQGDKVDVISKTVGSDGKSWYQVWINGVDKGFIRADLVDVEDDSSIATLKNNDTAASTVPAAETPSDTTAVPTDARRATVSTNGTRIRKGASTSDDVIATANRGMVLTVTGEANGSDGKMWYQVAFTYNDREITGFIRSDLITFEEVSPDEAVSNITGTEEGGEQPQTEEQPPQEEQPQEAQPEENAQQPASDVQVVKFMNTDEKPYIMPGFVLVDIKVSEEEKVKAWKYNDYVICYADVNGSQGWYLIENFSDPQNCVIQKYAYAGVTENPDGSSENILPMVVLAVIIVILLAVIGVMFLKLKDYGGGYDDDDDDDDDYYGDDGIDELEDEEDIPPAPVRRPSRPMPQQGQGQQPQRRPVPQQGQGQQPQRRPMPQQGQGQPQRRPAPQQPSDNDMRRRPEGDGRVVARPNGQRSGGQAPQRKNPQGQNQRGKAKNSSGNGQNNDMDFIDI